MTFTRTFSRSIVFTSILFSSVSVYGMEEEQRTPLGQQSISFFSLGSATGNSQLENEDNEALSFGNLNDHFDKDLFEESYARVPADIDRIVRRSLDPNELKLTLKAFALVGPTGSGKSIAARAIARKMNREYLFVSSLELLGSVLHKGVENVRALFKGLLKFEKLPILILDEANYLGDDYIKGNSDAKFTVSQLWSKLDSLETREDFFMIVTGNKFSELPPQLQDRLTMHFYELPYLPSASERIKSAIKKYPGYSAANDCNEEFFSEFAPRTESLSVRVINGMVEFAIGLAWARKDKIITRKDLNDSCERAHSNRQKYCDFTPHVAPEERRHQEMKDLQRESLTQSQKQHEATQEFNQLNGLCNAIAQDKATAASCASILPIVGPALAGLAQLGSKSNAEIYADAMNFQQQRLQQPQSIRPQAQRALQIANFPMPIQEIIQEMQEIMQFPDQLLRQSQVLQQLTKQEPITAEARIMAGEITKQSLLFQDKLQKTLFKIHQMKHSQSQNAQLNADALDFLRYAEQKLLRVVMPALQTTLDAVKLESAFWGVRQPMGTNQQNTQAAQPQQPTGIPPKDKEEADSKPKQQQASSGCVIF